MEVLQTGSRTRRYAVPNASQTLKNRVRVVAIILFCLVVIVFQLPRNRAAQALLIGDSYFLGTNGPKAFEYYSKALSIQPDSWRANLRMASLFDRVQDPVQADRYYQEALRLAPQELGVLEGAAAFYLKHGDLERAHSYLRSMLSQEPANFEALFLLAEVAEKRGDQAASESWLDKVLEHNPNHYEAHWQLANTLTDHQPEKALESVFRMLDSGPPPPRLRRGLLLMGQLYLRLGEGEAAREAWERLLREYPGSPEANQAMELVDLYE